MSHALEPPAPPCHKLSHLLRPPPPLERDVVYGRTLMFSFSILTPPKYRVSCLFKTLLHGLLLYRTPMHHHITLVLKSLHWLKIPERIHFKVLSLTYNSPSLPSPRTFANSSPSSQPALLDHYPVYPFSTPGHFSSHACSPTEPYPSLHHVFGMTYHLNSAPFLYLHCRHCLQ